METFQGESFHTSRWDYDVDLEGKRVGIIGTGATAVQAIPELAKVAGELYVFQRTPSTIDVRDQRATTEEEIETWANEPGWARARRARFAKISAGRTAIQANDDYLAGKVDDFKERKAARAAAVARGAGRASSSTPTSGSWSRSARASTPSSRTRRPPPRSKPYYPYGCKRPTFHDEYLPTFNLPNVHLVDTAPDRRQGDQRARRRPRRRRVPPRRADLRHRLRVDGDLHVQHGRRPRRPDARARSGRPRAPRRSSACTPRASRTCSS